MLAEFPPSPNTPLKPCAPWAHHSRRTRTQWRIAMTRFALSLLLALGLTAAAQASNDDLDIDKVNGSIHVPDNATVGKLSTVNGSVHVGANAHAKSAETVNGGTDR